MTGHIELPALDPQPGVPTTVSAKIVTGLLRGQMGFNGLIYTDSMRMRAISELMSPGEAAAAAITAGHDVVLHSPDDAAAFAGIKAAVASGQLHESQVDASVERVLRAKANLGLHRARAVSVEAVPEIVGSRMHGVVAREVSERSITLIKDDRGRCPSVCRTMRSWLYLSVLDYPAGWGIAAPSRTFIPELKERWPDVTAIELSDQTSLSGIDLIRQTASRYDAIIAAVFVRTSAFSGRMDLSPALVQLLRDLSESTERHGQPYLAVLFGNPYTATFLPEVPADDAHLRLLRSCRGVGRAGADGRVGCPGALADRVVHGVSGRPRTGAEGARAGRSALRAGSVPRAATLAADLRPPSRMA